MKTSIPLMDIVSINQVIYGKYETEEFLVAENEVMNTLGSFPMRPDFFILAFTLSGTAKIGLNGQEVQCGRESLIVYTPYHVINVLELSPDYQCRVIGLKKEYIIAGYHDINYLNHFSFFKAGAFPIIRLDGQEAHLFNSYFDYAQDTLRNKTHLFRKELFRNAARNLLFEIESIYRKRYIHHKNAPLNQKERIRERFMTLLKNHFKSQKKVSFYAYELNVTSKHLGKVLMETAGKSSKALIDNMVISEAKALLASGNVIVKEIVSTLHFGSIASFSHFFKRHAGLSPSEFIKQTNQLEPGILYDQASASRQK